MRTEYLEKDSTGMKFREKGYREVQGEFGGKHFSLVEIQQCLNMLLTGTPSYASSDGYRVDIVLPVVRSLDQL